MNGPLVSVIVPVFNAAPFLDELCRSIQAQSHANFEALFLDDGSTDESRTVLQKYAKDSRFNITAWQQNQGVTAASAELLRRMRGDYWCHPGADDVLESTFIEKRLNIARRFPDAAIIHGPGQIIDEHGSVLPSPALPGMMPEMVRGRRSIEILLEHNIINTPAVLGDARVTRSILDKFAGPWRYAQDWFLWLLHAATGRPLVWQPESLHKYRVHSRSLSCSASHAATREAETRLVPLCALAAARDISATASDCWERWKGDLYALWLRRALKLQRAGKLDSKWLTAGFSAFYGVDNTARNFHWECVRNMRRILAATVRENRARARNRFAVSGLARIGDPIFRSPECALGS